MSTVLATSYVVAPEARNRQSPNGTGGINADPSLLEFYRDLLEPFGESVNTERLRARRPVFHRDLVEHLVDDRIRATAPDLVVLAHALPDVTPFTPAAAHLTMLLGGGATMFGISQHGLAAPFTAVRVADLFRRSRRCSRALVAVLEQITLPSAHALAEDTPVVDSGALIVLGESGGTGLTLRDAVVLASGASPVRRLRELAEPDPEGTLLVLGPWMDRDELVSAGIPGTHRELDPGTYCTSVWLELARAAEQWAGFRRVVLADTDPVSRRSALAVFDGQPADARKADRN